MKLLIDGQWKDPESGKFTDKMNPSTGEAIEKIPAAGKGEVDEAMDAAEGSFWKWYELGTKERSKIIMKAVDLIQKSRKELEDILVLENGKRRIESVGDTRQSSCGL